MTQRVAIVAAVQTLLSMPRLTICMALKLEYGCGEDVLGQSGGERSQKGLWRKGKGRLFQV